jgi:hypothetical protein
MTCMATRLQTLLANHDSLGSPPLDVSFVVVVINIINVIISTTLPTGRASPPAPFPGGSFCSLASTQHTLEHPRNVNANFGQGPPPSLPPPGDNNGNKDGGKDDDSITITSLDSDVHDTKEGRGLGNCCCRPIWVLTMAPLLPLLPAMAPRMSSAYPSLVATAPAHHAVNVHCPDPVCQDISPLQDRRSRVDPTGHLCCRHTSSANPGSDSTLALLYYALACCH